MVVHKEATFKLHLCEVVSWVPSGQSLTAIETNAFNSDLTLTTICISSENVQVIFPIPSIHFIYYLYCLSLLFLSSTLPSIVIFSLSHCLFTSHTQSKWISACWSLSMGNSQSFFHPQPIDWFFLQSIIFLETVFKSNIQSYLFSFSISSFHNYILSYKYVYPSQSHLSLSLLSSLGLCTILSLGHTSLFCICC